VRVADALNADRMSIGRSSPFSRKIRQPEQLLQLGTIESLG
jgi:hypothetical protein